MPQSESSNPLLTAKYIIPRSSLPLAYLDPATDGGGTSGSRLFAAQIDYLEEQSDRPPSENPHPQVVLGQSKECDRLYAIERVRPGLYTFCRLGQWVTEDGLRDLTKPASDQTLCLPRTAPRGEQTLPAKEWWRNAVAPAHDSSRVLSLDRDAIVRAPDFKISLERPSRRHTSSVPTYVLATPTIADTAASGQKEAINEGTKKSETSLEVIKTHYQDALYLSRAPLAYFAKGPLSRARASFHDHESCSNNFLTLIQYLRTLILDLQVMDKKYRETLPGIIRELPNAPLSDGEGAPIIEGVRKKSRRSKKTKVGKDGLYAGEDVIVARWWLGRDMSDNSGDSDDAHQESVKATILNLRRREAQLQIILLLETLALEENVDLVENPVQSEEIGLKQDGSIPKAKQAKKPQDLHTLLDLIADRFCIWQSMSVEEKSDTKHRPQGDIPQKRADHPNNDDLRQFCIDVVVPLYVHFYSDEGLSNCYSYASRLPETSTLLCQKLGGPKDPSPKRPFTKVSQARAITSTRPGAPLPRPQPRKQRRTLERVLTAEKSSRRRTMPSLSRSATEPLVPVKREVSDLTLSSIPLNKVAISKRYTQREVDLGPTAQATESKQKKKAAIEQELQGAIAAIKRPNPKMAGVEFAETVEKRQADSQSRSMLMFLTYHWVALLIHSTLETTKSVRKSSSKDFQVMATPSKNKNAGTYRLPSLPEYQHATLPSEVHEVPPSSANQVEPSSMVKVLDTISFVENHTTRKDRQRFLPLDQTPSRGPAKFVDRFSLYAGEPPIYTSCQSQALRPPTYGIQETPSKRSNQQSSAPPRPLYSTQLTPCKAIPVQRSAPDVLSPYPQIEEEDLYASLGWNDEVDD